MQTRKSLLRGDRPQCPVDPRHPVDCHGQYARFADGQERTKSKWIPRFACRICWRTISVLPEDTLPYRAVSVGKVEASFDAKAAGQREPPVSEVERGCLRRAWARLRQRKVFVLAVLGQMIELLKPSVSELWNQLRRFGNLEGILDLLGRKDKTSLLGDYRCLKPWPPPPPAG